MKLNQKFDLNKNAGDGIDLGVNPDEESRWSVRFSKVIEHSYRGVTRALQETLCKDQRDNYMLVYSTELRDHERYDWYDWVRPSMFDVSGGWTDDLFTYYRNGAMKAFENSEKNINNEKILAKGNLAPGLSPAVPGGPVISFTQEDGSRVSKRNAGGHPL